MSLRPAAPGDHATLREIETAAFGRTLEGEIADALRADCDTLVELLAERNGQVVGHVVFSRMRLNGSPSGRVAALGPVAVRPDQQRSGVGSALIETGLRRCRELGVSAVCLLGDPSYYRRFGFRWRTASKLQSRSAGPAFLAIELQPDGLSGVESVDFAAAFDADGQEQEGG